MFSASETAAILYRAFGAARAWEDFLADVRRGKISYGPILMPFGKLPKKGVWLPVYHGAAIKKFIGEFAVHEPSARAKSLISPMVIDVDPADKRHWKVRKLRAAITV